MKNIIHSLLLFITTITLVSCSSVNEPVPHKNELSGPIAFDLFIARSSLMRPIEFEQYTSKSNKLFQECGKIRNDRFFTDQQELLTLEQDSSDRIYQAALRLVSNLDKHTPTFAKPALKNRFFSSGQAKIDLEINGKNYLIDTSLDSISSPSSSHERETLAFIKEVRKVSTTICGNNSFFGITRD